MRIQGETETTQPRRGHGKAVVIAASGGARLHWRVVVSAGERLDASRGQQPLAWHLVECGNPRAVESHCEAGQRLMQADGNPDGHCLVADECPRCAQASAAEPAAEPPAEPAPEPTAEAPLAEATSPD
jgi:hypothetical protein